MNADRARAALWSLDPECDADTHFRHACGAADAGLTFDDFLEWSKGGGNFKGESNCRATWKSASKPGAVTKSSLFRAALAIGWNDPAKTSTKGSNTTRPSPSIAKPSPSPAKPVKEVPQAVADLWNRLEPATLAHGYIAKKKGTPEGLRIVGAGDTASIAEQSIAGCLAVPCRAIDGELQTLQLIPAEGKKLNMPGASFGEGFFTVGTIADRVYICEGIGQAWAVNQATGCAAVVTFGSTRTATVAKALRAKYPAARLVIVPDKGMEDKAAAIAADVAGEWVTMPADKPSNYDANDFMQEVGADALAALLERPQCPPVRYNLLTDADLHKLPPMQWRIKGVLPADGLAAVFGASGSGKSFLVLDTLQSLAAGADWFGHRVKPCPVIYCALEGEGGIAGRVNAYRIRHGSTSENIRYLVQPFSLLDGGDVHDLAQAIKANGNSAGVVVLDTLNRAAPGADENDSKAMGQIIASAKELQTLVGGLVLLVHHTGKDASKGLRGHSSLHAALDAAVEVRRDGDRREWLIAKSKDGEDGAAHPFRLDVVELGNDEDGEPVTSCVVHPVEEVADSIRRALPPKSGNQRTVWDALGEIFRKAGAVKPEGAPDTLPQGRPCVRLEAAIEQTRGRLVCDTKRQTERTQAAIRGLVERGLLQHEAGFLWCK